ncbi:MAG: tryptophan 7-halogenase [Xanthobacteraceae bacterium]
MWDVIVAGAGPAGSVAAAKLARAGRRVLLADRPSAAWKFGEALPGAAVRLLRTLDLPAPGPVGPHTSIAGTLSAWGSPQFTATDALRDPYGAAWRLDRHRFDAELRAAACVAGATARIALVRDVVRDGDGWRLRFDDGGEECARWIVDASGRSARIARKLGAERRRDSRLIALYRVGEADAEFRDSRTVIESASNGWWYAARLPSSAAVAGLHTDAAEAVRIRAEPQAWLNALAATRGPGALFSSMRFAQLLPAADAGGARLSQFYGEGWVACGDSAISFDPISGQGIFAALHDGSAAADAVNAALCDEPALLAAYARRLEQVWSIYSARRDAVYASERRWPDQPFWSRGQWKKAA